MDINRLTLSGTILTPPKAVLCDNERRSLKAYFVVESHCTWRYDDGTEYPHVVYTLCYCYDLVADALLKCKVKGDRLYMEGSMISSSRMEKGRWIYSQKLLVRTWLPLGDTGPTTAEQRNEQAPEDLEKFCDDAKAELERKADE